MDMKFSDNLHGDAYIVTKRQLFKYQNVINSGFFHCLSPFLAFLAINMKVLQQIAINRTTNNEELCRI